MRWQLAIQSYIEQQGYPLGTLVAFSGEVNDTESGPDPFTETSKALNPTLQGRDIREAFKLPEFNILLVANKFQTGFDQPLLCGMYVDRRLAGIQAVQTLSRLNRAHPGKDTTYVLDFANSSEDIRNAFQTYYDTAQLEDVTDPNLVYDLKAKLDGSGWYDTFEVDRVVKVELNPASKQSALVAAITPVADRLLKAYKDAQAHYDGAIEAGQDRDAKQAKDTLDALLLFRNDMGAFGRLYSFLSQIFDFGNTALEARSIFYRRLVPLLEFGRQREGVDISKVVLTHHRVFTKGKQALPLSDDGEKLKPITESGAGSIQEKEKALLSAILEKVNGLFQGDVTETDQLVYVNNVLKGKLLDNGTLAEQAAHNSKQQFASSPDLPKALFNAIIDAFDAHQTMSKQALDSSAVREGLKDALLGPGHLYELLKARHASGARTDV